MNRLAIFKEMWDYIRTTRMWFLVPLFILFGLLVFMAALVHTSPIFLPFIYAGF